MITRFRFSYLCQRCTGISRSQLRKVLQQMLWWNSRMETAMHGLIMSSLEQQKMLELAPNPTIQHQMAMIRIFTSR